MELKEINALLQSGKTEDAMNAAQESIAAVESEIWARKALLADLFVLMEKCEDMQTASQIPEETIEEILGNDHSY